MFVTKELLDKYEACDAGVNFFNKHFPNGAELETLIRIRHLPVSFLHWGRRNLPANEKEINAYEEVCANENCQYCFEIDHCANSSFLSSASLVKDSEYVFNSSSITNSQNIMGCTMVDNSNFIYYSKFVYNSKLASHTENVTDSYNIVNSKAVLNSSDIIKCENVTDSFILNNSFNITDSILLNNCKNCKKCICCTDLDGAEYMIYNQAVEPRAFDNYVTQFKLLNYGDIQLFECPEDGAICPSDPKTILNPQLHFINIEDILWTWCKSLPNYNASILYKLTYNPDLLLHNK